MRARLLTLSLYLGAFIGAWILWTINKLWR
jgi:hypothetical protein